jgi:signal transduction histidine kinase
MTIVYRIAQEALLNAARHAMAGSVAVAVTGHDGGVAVEVADDGIGFEPGTTRSGSGLATIELFTELGRGRLAVRSAPGQGTVVRSVLGARSGDGPGRRDQRRHLRLIPAVDRSPATGAPDPRG